MSTDRVSPPSSMLELVRALSSARGEATAKAAVSTPMAHELRENARDLSALRRKLSIVLDRLDPGDEGAVAEVRRPVLQEIVLWEFGENFRQHPEFVPMLDSLERTFEADPKAPERFAALVRDLKR